MLRQAAVGIRCRQGKQEGAEPSLLLPTGLEKGWLWMIGGIYEWLLHVCMMHDGGGASTQQHSVVGSL
jgi:hypothetical protein